MRLRLKPSVALLVTAFAVFAISQTALRAQNNAQAPAGDAAAAEPPADLAAGKRVWTNTAECVRCHGWAGNGTPQGPGLPPGANLREMTLPPDALAELIRCGVLSSEMPSFGRGAWSSSTCFGLTADQVGAARPSADGHQLSDAQIASLVTYLEYQVMGHGPINLADCEAYYGAGASQCRPYQ